MNFEGSTLAAVGEDDCASAVVRRLTVAQDASLTWDYERVRPALGVLYEKAKVSQWDGSDLPWDLDVDWGRVAASGRIHTRRFNVLKDSDSPVAAWSDREWSAFEIELHRTMLSQFLHGEQGALVCAALITSTVPWIDAKIYGATQVMDEARHVEVFSRYLVEKTAGPLPISPHLRVLLDAIVTDHRWDITYLGMQIMVEGLALAAFAFMHALTTEPLLKQLLRAVMRDESRHVAFGTLSLREVYAGLTSSEVLERQAFALDAAMHLRNRFLDHDAWTRLGASPQEVSAFLLSRPDSGQVMFQRMLFGKVVPNLGKLGLLDANGGWLRKRLLELGVA